MAAAVQTVELLHRKVRKHFPDLKRTLDGVVAGVLELEDVMPGEGEDAVDSRLWTVRFGEGEVEEQFVTSELLRLLLPERKRGGAEATGAAASGGNGGGHAAAGARMLAPAGGAKAAPALAASKGAKRAAGAQPAAAAKRPRPAPPPPPPHVEPVRDHLAECALDMSGAAVAEVPPLRAGEVRVLGQTLTPDAAAARRHVVTAWRSSKPEASRWAEVLTDADAAEARAIKAALRSHLGFDKKKEAELLLAALPPDTPVSPLVETFTIPGDDPREGLRGQLGVRVRAGPHKGLPAHTIVGNYRCKTLTRGEYSAGYKSGAGGDGAAVRLPYSAARAAAAAVPLPGTPEHELAGLAPLENELLAEAFAGEYSNWDRMTADPAFIAQNGQQPALVAAAYAYGNEMCLINDAVGPPTRRDAAELEAAHAAENVKLVEIKVHGWPTIFVITTRVVPPGEELMMTYGHGYWEGMHRIAQRLSWAREVLAQSAARLAQPAAPPVAPSSGGEAGAAGASDGSGGGGSGDGGAAAAVQPLQRPLRPVLRAERRGAGNGAAAAGRHVGFAAPAPPARAPPWSAEERARALRWEAKEGQDAFAPVTADAPPPTDELDAALAADADAATAARVLSAALRAAAAGADGAPSYDEAARLATELAVCKAHALQHLVQQLPVATA